MKISVIVPVYNVEKYLEQCLHSIREQTYSDLEIIIVNDGSTDRSAKICDEFAAKDSRIKVVHQINSGVSVARNTGIEIATGEFITFVDSDDWLELQMYESMIATLEKNPDLEIMMCDSTLITALSKINTTEFIRAGYYLKSDIIAELYPTLLVTEDFGKIPIVSACSCLLRRNVLAKNHIRFDPKLKYSEDYLFMAELMIQANSFFYLKGEHFYNYRQYEESRSKKFQSEWWSNFLDLNNKLCNLLADSKEFDFTRQLKLQLIHSALFLTSAIYNNSQMSDDEKLKLLQKLFTDRELKATFANLNFRKQSISLIVVLCLLKYRLPQCYLVYRDFISKIKS